LKRFAELYTALDASTATNDKLAALIAYLRDVPAGDAAWAVYFLAGGKPRRTVPAALLRATAQAQAGIPDWLFEESYANVGDMAETIALLLPPPVRRSDLGLAQWMEERLLPLRGQSPAAQEEALLGWWQELDAGERFLLVKLVGGGFRVGVSRLLVQRALAQAFGLDPALVDQRMVGYTDARAMPGAASFEALRSRDTADLRESALPYPFFLAHPLDAQDLEATLGELPQWQLEWKYDGIRAQAVKRGGRLQLWSRGEELISESFPEVLQSLASLPDRTVLDGELLVWPEGAAAPAAFTRLQQRLNRKSPGKKLLAEQPVCLLAYDLLERHGEDLRQSSQAQRREALEALAPQVPGLRLAPLVQAHSHEALRALHAQAREHGVEGLMLKQRSGSYGIGRTKALGLWFKWKVQPMAVDAVLIYAQAGHGRRASLYTDYTFAVWSRPPESAAQAQAVVEAIVQRRPPVPGALQLMAFAKAYSGLSDEELKRVDREIRSHTLEKFGPVRSVRPTLVFELGFEGIGRSPRHKSGIAVRFPRILRIRDDKPLHEADSLQSLQALISAQSREQRG
jgi:DNA ligase 1